MMGRSLTLDEDPLTLAILPPVDETPDQREARESVELEARRRSDEIDEQLRSEKAALKKKKRPVKVLLLGQSESGKSSTLKNFQLTYSRREWTEERASWRCVVQLNLLRNVNTILDILGQEISAPSHPHSEPQYHDDIPEPDISIVDIVKGSTTPAPKLKFTEKHRLLKLRLGPLSRVQKDLEHRLGTAASEVYSSHGLVGMSFGSPTGQKLPPEFSINSNDGWKTALDKLRPLLNRTEGGSTRKPREAESDETTDVIAGCKDDMKSIWEDPVVRMMLTRRKFRIEDTPGFFLNDVERIAVHDYLPTDDDVIRARLRTLGVQEHRFVFEQGRMIGQEWLMYDVGGTRSSRAAWYPYFDDADAIIFLAPISCFDEKLVEDKSVNRLEDSYLLWKSVCACKLLAKTQLILFLNKCDLLQAKLMRGVKIRDCVPSFGDRKNEISAATKYFQQHFKEISRQHSPVPRPLYIHLTSVIDTRSTAATLGAVEESILRNHLRRADLIL
jgi:guanine nucleotide-binding protein subunit alpha